ncbi:MAG: GNAT family N-acetyltransferase [Oscillospiraceae bacterium]
MEQNNIEYRKLERSDYPALEKIIRETWKYETFCSPKVAKKMSKVFLASCLCNQTFNCVAINNGEPVGIILGKYIRDFHAPIKLYFRLFFSICNMLISKEGRMVTKKFKVIQKIDEALLKETDNSFDCELAFFAIDASQRGNGIGKHLFDNFVSYMNSKNCNSFFLYTDSTCNFGFYEHQGMKRLGEKVFRTNPSSGKEINFYIYSN